MGAITLTLNEWLEYTDNVGLENYPIFDETYRATLNTKILNRYDAREIGFETGEQFSFALSRRMHEIMPYYNKLYESELLVIDPLNTIKMHSTDANTSTGEDTTAATSDTTSSSNNYGKNVAYEMPQVPLSGSQDYASSAADSTGTGSSTGESNTNGTTNSTNSSTSDSNVEGYQGSQADLLARYRDTFLNIDVAIINNLADLFLTVIDIPNSYLEESEMYPYGRLY